MKSFVKPLKAKCIKFEKDNSGKPKTLDWNELITDSKDNKYLFLMPNDKFKEAWMLESEYVLPFKQDGKRLLFCCLKGSALENIFSLNFITDSKDDTDKLETFIDDWLISGGFSLILCEGNHFLELLCDLLEGYAFTYNGKIPETINGEITEVITSYKAKYDEGSLNKRDFRDKFSKAGVAAPIFWDDFDQLEKMSRSFLVIPDFVEGNYPNSLKLPNIKLPEIKEAGAKKNWSGGGAKAYTGKDRMNDIYNMLIGSDSDKFNELYDVIKEDTGKFDVALAICGVNSRTILLEGDVPEEVPPKKEPAKFKTSKTQDLKALASIYKDCPELFEEGNSTILNYAKSLDGFTKTNGSEAGVLTKLNEICEICVEGNYYPDERIEGLLKECGMKKDTIFQETPTQISKIHKQLLATV